MVGAVAEVAGGAQSVAGAHCFGTGGADGEVPGVEGREEQDAVEGVYHGWGEHGGHAREVLSTEDGKRRGGAGGWRVQTRGYQSR